MTTIDQLLCPVCNQAVFKSPTSHNGYYKVRSNGEIKPSQVDLDGERYHKQCAKCSQCNCHLLPGNFKKDSNSVLYCSLHYPVVNDDGNSSVCSIIKIQNDEELNNDKENKNLTSDLNCVPLNELTTSAKNKKSFIEECLADIDDNTLEVVQLLAYTNPDKKIPLKTFLYLFSSETELFKQTKLLYQKKLLMLQFGKGNNEKYICSYKHVQDVIRNQNDALSLTSKMMEKLAFLLSQQLLIIEKNVDENQSILEAAEPILTHMRTVVKHYECFKDKVAKEVNLDLAMSELYLSCGLYYIVSSELDDAINTLNKGLVILNYYNIKDLSSFAACFHRIANVYESKCDYEKAIQVFNQVLYIYTTMEDAAILSDMAKAYQNIAQVYLNSGNCDEALNMYAEALNMNKCVYGDFHPNVAEIFHQIGSVYDKACDYEMALIIYEKCFEIRKQIFGMNHYDVANCLNDMALVYNNKGDYSKALQKFKESLKIKKLIYGVNHQDIASSLSNIALVYCNKSDYNKALPKYEEALKIYVTYYANTNKSDIERINNRIQQIRLFTNSSLLPTKVNTFVSHPNNLLSYFGLIKLQS